MCEYKFKKAERIPETNWRGKMTTLTDIRNIILNNTNHFETPKKNHGEVSEQKN